MVVGGDKYSTPKGSWIQPLSYEGISFKCRRCFKTGHVVSKCELQRGKTINSSSWWNGVSSQHYTTKRDGQDPPPPLDPTSDSTPGDIVNAIVPSVDTPKTRPLPILVVSIGGSNALVSDTLIIGSDRAPYGAFVDGVPTLAILLNYASKNVDIVKVVPNATDVVQMGMIMMFMLDLFYFIKFLLHLLLMLALHNLSTLPGRGYSSIRYDILAGCYYKDGRGMDYCKR